MSNRLACSICTASSLELADHIIHCGLDNTNASFKAIIRWLSSMAKRTERTEGERWSGAEEVMKLEKKLSKL